MNFNLPDKHHAICFIRNNHTEIVNFIKLKLKEISKNDVNDISKFKYTSALSKTITICYDDKCNISVNFPKESSFHHVMTYPGTTILFPLINEFSVNYYTIDPDLEKIVKTERKKISAAEPLYIDGVKNTYDFHDEINCLVANLNYPEITEDIDVYNKKTFAKDFWFMADKNSARYLFILEALTSIKDKGALNVAREIIYHYHPAVQWEAYRIIYELAPHERDFYKKILLKSQNPKLVSLVMNIASEDG